MGSSIYFAYDLELNGIKVGKTKNKVSSRITEELELVGSVAINDGDHDLGRLETAIHYCLRDHAIHGERFYPDKRVFDFVNIALSDGLGRALSALGDDAFFDIGFRKHYHKKMTHYDLRGSIRQGHLTRMYAGDAYDHARLSREWDWDLEPKRNFLRRWPLREFRVCRTRLLALKGRETLAILVEDETGSEIVEEIVAA